MKLPHLSDSCQEHYMILVFHFLVLHFSIHKLTIRLFILYNKIILLLIYLLSSEVREGPK